MQQLASGDSLPAGTPVLIYVRISPGHSEENISLDAMEAECRAFAAGRGWTVTQVIADDRISGKSVDDRPGFREVLALARRRAFKAVVFWKQSRVFRNVEEYYAYRTVLKRSEVQLVSVKEPLPGGPLGEAMAGILAIVDDLYASQIAEDTRRNLKYLAAQGWWPGGKPPIGGQLVKVKVGTKTNGEDLTRTKLVPDPEWAPHVLKAFEMDDAGDKASEIIAATGIGRNRSALCDILINETYGDNLVYNRRRQAGHRNKRAKNAPEELIIGAGHGLKIVPQDLLERVITTRRARSALHPARITSSYLLSDVLWCSCGGQVRGDGRRGQRLYTCKQRRLASWGLAPIMADELEAVVVATIRDDIASLPALRKACQRWAEQIRRQTASDKERVSVLQAERRTVAIERDRYLAAIRDGVPGRLVATPLEACEDRLTALDRDITAALTPRSPFVVTEALVRDTRDALLRRLEEDATNLIRDTFSKIVVDGPGGHLEFHVSGEDWEDEGGTAYPGHTTSSRVQHLPLPVPPRRSLPAALITLRRPGPKAPGSHAAARRRNAEMIARRKAGTLLRVLAADYGIGIQRVSRICRRGAPSAL